jgi:precorrin-3B C17-methyltransferase
VTGWVRVIGLGPGPDAWLTEEARLALAEATDLIGYVPYVSRVPPHEGLRVHSSGNGDELDRARHALTLAQRGARVAVVSGGDAGVFGMASAVFEAIDRGPSELRSLEVTVLPGVTAMLAAAARLGAPLGNDFCAINLSDNLKPWSVIAKRLMLATQADFVIALYNPASKARPTQIHDAFAIVRQQRVHDSPVMLAKAVGRPDEELIVATLGNADPNQIDMRTLVIFGAPSTRVLARADKTPWVYTPRWLSES